MRGSIRPPRRTGGSHTLAACFTWILCTLGPALSLGFGASGASGGIGAGVGVGSGVGVGAGGFGVGLGVVFGGVGAALAGCAVSPQQVADGRDPLRSLSSTADSRLYDLAFWARQERLDGKLWHDAADYCASRSEIRHPNCRNVRMAGWWAAPPPPPSLPGLPAPAIGPLPRLAQKPAATAQRPIGGRP